MRRHEGTLLLVLAVLWLMASLAMGCATRQWGHKRVLCRPAEDVTMKEFLSSQDLKWEFKELKGKRIVCASKRLGGSRLGK